MMGYRDQFFFHVIPALKNNPEGYRIIMGLSFLMFFFFSHYVRHYLDLQRLSPILDKAYKYYSWIHVGLVFIIFFPLQLYFQRYHLAVDIVVGIIPLFLLLNLVTVVFLFRKKETLYNFFIAGFLCIIIGMIIAVFIFTVYSQIFNIVIKTSVMAEALIFSLGLGYRMRKIELDKIKAQEELTRIQEKSNLILEEKVHQRTQQLENANTRLNQSNEEIRNQRDRLGKTLKQLKEAQVHLIHSEKMASLGELTAGIAHEIRNPLNFINNFSEVNVELVDELNAEIEKGNLDEIKAISKDLRENEEKVIEHGIRAAAIVENMLQHSRGNSTEKILTDINALTDEYMGIAYHSLRAKDKSFNTAFETDFTKDLPKIHVIPQNIGRVLLNLITNSIHAVTEKSKQNISGYTPYLKVSTRMLKDNIEIHVKDNGNGIPEKIKSKIFQPFFTTKPAGHGTGLGLSLSYDIIIKGHGGDLIFNSIENEGTEFIIQLPLN